jgi:hypothetical protein
MWRLVTIISRISQLSQDRTYATTRYISGLEEKECASDDMNNIHTCEATTLSSLRDPSLCHGPRSVGVTPAGLKFFTQ